jgi:CRP-like cAMP-binding protein
VYLTHLSKLMDLFKKDQNQNMESLIYKISLALKHQFLLENRMVFRFGDKGEFFYILLKGKVEILVPTEIRVMMTDQEFIRYVLKLKRNDEVELANKVMQKNEGTFQINNVLLETWLNNNKTSFYQKKPLIYNQLSKDIEDTIYSMNLKKIKSDIVDMPWTAEEYINSTSIDFDENTDQESYKRQFIAYKYLHLNSYTKGNIFGENALDNARSMRMATIITSEDTHLGVLNKKTFQECMKDVVDQDKKSNINFLVSTQLFCNINKMFFQKQLYNGFSLNDKLTRHSKLMIEGDKPGHIFIIKEGEFEVVMKKSTLQINDMITVMGGKHKTDYQFEMEDNPKFYKYLNEKKYTKICIVKEREILGLDDYIFQDKYSFTVECLSNKGVVLVLDKNFVTYNLI